MRVALFVTCLVDQLWPSVGVGAVDVLRRVGCDVTFDPRATCCGQPAFNTGYRDETRIQAQQWIESFERSGCEHAVLPSGSCGAMAHHFPVLFGPDDPWRERAERMAAATHELSQFLVTVVGATDLGARWPGRVFWHDACHGLRDLNVRDEPRALLAAVDGLELVDTLESDTCCGFGGTFAVKYPEISVSILDRKIEAIEAAGVDAVASCDVSCLMQIGGRLSRNGSKVRTLHLAEILAAKEPV